MKMVKKGLALAFAAAIALTLAGCANSSDSGAAIFAGGTGTGNGGGNNGGNNGRVLDRTGLPANVGSNDFVGKTFSYTDDNGQTAKYAFGSDTVTFTSTFPSAETVTVSSYSFNATTKQLFLKEVSSSSYFINDGTRTAMPEMDSFTSDAEFIAAHKKGMKQLYPSYTDEQLTNLAKEVRFTTFAPYGYTDSTNATEVSNEIIAKYNAAQAESKTRNTLVDIYAYDLSGSTLKRLNDSRIPAGKGLNEIYGVYNTRYFVPPRYVDILAIKDGSDNIVYNLNYSSTPSITPDIINAAGNAGYRVSSISESAINTSATATKTSSVWTFTPATDSFSYTTNKTATSGVFDITGLGKITVTYATAGNIPTDWTAAATYTVDNTQSGGSALPDKPWLKAEAVDGGIKFTIKALGAKYNTTDCFIFSKETEPCDIGRFYPEWSDRTKDWTGVYPYVSAGQKYKFGLIISGLTDETVEVTATGGLGQIPYDANTRSCISVDDTGIDVFVDKCPPTVIPAGVTNKKAFTSFFAGEWTTNSWNGEWVDYLEKAEADFVQPDASGNCVYHIANTDALYTRLKTAMTGKYSGKKMFIEFTYRYKLEGFAAECQSRQLRSAPMSVEWTALQNESAHFKAETVSGGVKLTIKKSAASTAYGNGNQIIVRTNDGSELGRVYPEWTDKSQDWTCVYPFVDNGKTYQIEFLPFDNSMREKVKFKAGGGSGEITYGANPYAINPSVHLGLSADKTAVGAFNYPPSLIPASVTDKKAYMAYWAGTGWNDATQTWDANLILERRETSLEEPENGSCVYYIMSSDPDYTTIKNAMKDTYPTKKMFAQFYYEFKVDGISGTCYTRFLDGKPVDASVLRQ